VRCLSNKARRWFRSGGPVKCRAPQAPPGRIRRREGLAGSTHGPPRHSERRPAVSFSLPSLPTMCSPERRGRSSGRTPCAPTTAGGRAAAGWVVGPRQRTGRTVRHAVLACPAVGAHAVRPRCPFALPREAHPGDSIGRGGGRAVRQEPRASARSFVATPRSELEKSCRRPCPTCVLGATRSTDLIAKLAQQLSGPILERHPFCPCHLPSPPSKAIGIGRLAHPSVNGDPVRRPERFSIPGVGVAL